ncbi:MAG: hypothetical protein EXR07_06990 [Acetobacteraceae bacterium]|nr:hypothetical protein [Acetobacteraceae bacterium]
MTEAEFRTLLTDCLKLWGIQGKPRPGPDGWEIDTQDGAFSIGRADPDLRPARWCLQTPERRAAGRPPRMAPSIVAALSALRNNLGAARGEKLRIGGT